MTKNRQNQAKYGTVFGLRSSPPGVTGNRPNSTEKSFRCPYSEEARGALPVSCRDGKEMKRRQKNVICPAKSIPEKAFFL
jgi:hypothetical protein